ncbi:MAG: GxGYxYP domain-containing protein [Armatimonadota bacterium]
MIKELCIVAAVLLSASISYADNYESMIMGETGKSLPVFPKSAPPAKNLMHADLLEAPDDVRFALTVLQGLVNRTEPRIYISQNPEWHGPILISKWIDNLKGRGYSFTEATDPLSLVSQFRNSVKGAVLYESNLKDNPESLHKLNSITLYCALNDVIPVTEELNAKLKLPVLLDVRGKYNTANEAYMWAYKDLWPHANHKLTAHTHPTHIVLRDYLVAHKIMPFWISQGMDKASEETCLRFLDEAEANTPLMGCWGGYGEKPAGRMNEPNLQRLASLRGKFVVVTDGCFDLTVHSGLKFRKVRNINSKRKLTLDRSKVYICFNVTDGDNLQYLQQYFATKQWWEDPNRGKVPIGWSMSPNTADLMPDVLEYYLTTRTNNDEFVTPTGGIGLVTPALYGKDLYTNHEAVYNEYIRLTSDAMAKVGLTTIQLGDTSSVPWTRADFDKWARDIPGLKGIIGDYGGILGIDRADAAFLVYDDVPVARAIIGSPDPNSRGDHPEKAWAAAVRNVTPAKRPAFIHASVINWFDSPTSIMKAAEELGPEYVPVLPTELFDLMRQAKSAPAK